MKRLLLFLIIALLLCGCETGGDEPVESALPTTLSTEQTVSVTEPPIPWVEEFGTPWDKEGALLEIHMTIPDGMHYANFMAFDGDLLLWSLDSHREEYSILELCLIELDDGSIVSEAEFQVQGFPIPQALEDALYICSSESGLVLQLDKSLCEVRRWEPEPQPGNWYVGAEGNLYQLYEDGRVWVYALEDGTTEPLIDGDPEIGMFYPQGDTVSFEYFSPNTGARVFAALDLLTGEVITPDTRPGSESMTLSSDCWMSYEYSDGYVYHLESAEDTTLRIDTGDSMLELLQEGYLLMTSGDSTHLYLYDLKGNPVSSCQISATGNYYMMNPIWNEVLGGYFFQVGGFDADRRILFWDISTPSDDPALIMEPVPPLSDEEQALKLRALELSEKYGVDILVGSACEEVFADFTASRVTDYELVSDALDTLDAALAVYPEGFLRQLWGKHFNAIQIQLVADLIATGNGREGDGYAAFTQNMWDHYLMVMDIHDTTEMTYYHEFSHIIDSVLELDSYEREYALYSEVTWASFNPSWFDGYSYDYSVMQELKNLRYFVDSYSTISPTEDRARVMEYAMCDYGEGTFEDCNGLLRKLDYYCRCIRDAFDTTGWPETVIWEQYLYLYD